MIELIQQVAALGVDGSAARARFRGRQRRAAQSDVLAHNVRQPQQQGRQADGEQHGFDKFHRMAGEIAFDKGRVQRSAVDQGVKPGRAEDTPRNG